ncbi:amidohydrolase family protein [Clostridium sp. Marseille-P3244]|uniref:amidohydrolase family protein n=1 Tax=Clostridium sp. Marseille-P3244 TaxID=1871020 RepID=UPI000931BFD9|nr:amidohydrolase family protein [Clostridium sp. Marseille-P3244]
MELLITNIGKLVSGDINNPLLDADTIYIKDGKFAEIGKKEVADAHPGVQTLDAKGVTVAPGLIDSHCHPCAGDYTFRQKAADFLESEIHGGCTTLISAGEPHFPGRPTDPAGAKAQAIFLSKSFRNKSPLGAKVHGGALILEKGLTEKDFEEMEKEGVWLVGEIGLGSVKSPDDAAPLVEIAKRHGFKVHMHTGGTSIPGSSTVTADDVIRTNPTVASHCNGGPTAVSVKEVDRIISESDIAVEIVQCGNYRVAKHIYERVLELGKEDRIIFGNDAPSGTGFVSLGILRNVCYASLCGVVPEKALAMASGNTARTFGLNTGIIAVGKEADLICLDAPMGSVGSDALEAIDAGDIPAVTYIIVDGKVIVTKSRNTPPGNRMPEFVQ